MATHYKEIGPEGCTPDSTGRCFPEQYLVKATSDLFGHAVMVLNNPGAGEEHGFYGTFDVPANYVTSAVVDVAWTSTVTAGNARMRIRYRSVGGDDTESLDNAAYQETVAVTDVAPTATDRRLVASFTLTAGNVAAGELVEYYFTRLDDTGVDTLAGAITIHKMRFTYSDT